MRILLVLQSTALWTIGITLSVSAIIHLNNPYSFYDSILRYKIVSGVIAKSLAMWLPFFHLGLSYCIFFNRNRQFALMGCFALLCVYTAAITSVWLRGVKTTCGCFGESDELISEATIFRNILLCACCLVLATIDKEKKPMTIVT